MNTMYIVHTPLPASKMRTESCVRRGTGGGTNNTAQAEQRAPSGQESVFFMDYIYIVYIAAKKRLHKLALSTYGRNGTWYPV